MNNYSVIFSILGYYFKVVTREERLLNEQIRHIKKFCITDPIEKVDVKDYTTLEYIEDYELFTNMRKQFERHEIEKVKSFDKIFHMKFVDGQTEYFCQIDDEWILIKNNIRNYVVLGSGINNTIKYLFRVIREIIVRKQEDNKKIFMHATALTLNGKGIVMLGNKGSGKTTFFTKILDENTVRVLSNDRIFIYKFNSMFYMDYFPIPIVYKVGTVTNSRKLNQYIIMDNNYNIDQKFIEGNKSLPVPLTDLPKIFNDCRLIERHLVNYLIFTKFHLEWDKEIKYDILGQREAKNLLDNVCFTPIDYESDRVEWVYFRKTPFDDLIKVANQLTIEMSNKLKVIWVEFGRNSDVNSLLRDIIGN